MHTGTESSDCGERSVKKRNFNGKEDCRLNPQCMTGKDVQISIIFGRILQVLNV